MTVRGESWLCWVEAEMVSMVANPDVTSARPHGPGCPPKSSSCLGTLRDPNLEVTMEGMGRGCRALCHRAVVSHVWVAVSVCERIFKCLVSLTTGCASATWAHVHMTVAAMSHFQVPCIALVLALLRPGQLLGPVL